MSILRGGKYSRKNQIALQEGKREKMKMWVSGVEWEMKLRKTGKPGKIY